MMIINLRQTPFEGMPREREANVDGGFWLSMSSVIRTRLGESGEWSLTRLVRQFMGIPKQYLFVSSAGIEPLYSTPYYSFARLS